MPVPLVVPVLATLAGAVLSDELVDDEESEEEPEPPKWEIDIGDSDFLHADANGQTYRGLVFFDLENRKITGYTLQSNQQPPFRYDRKIVVGRVQGEGVRQWVEAWLEALEKVRSMDRHPWERDQIFDDMERDFQDRAWRGAVLRLLTPKEALDELSEANGRSRFARELLEKRQLIFDEFVGAEITGDDEDKLDAITDWLRDDVDLHREVARVLSLPSDESSLIQMIGNDNHGFDVLFEEPEEDDEDADEEERAETEQAAKESLEARWELIQEWGLTEVQRTDGQIAWRFMTKG